MNIVNIQSIISDWWNYDYHIVFDKIPINSMVILPLANYLADTEFWLTFNYPTSASKISTIDIKQLDSIITGSMLVIKLHNYCNIIIFSETDEIYLSNYYQGNKTETIKLLTENDQISGTDSSHSIYDDDTPNYMPESSYGIAEIVEFMCSNKLDEITVHLTNENSQNEFLQLVLDMVDHGLLTALSLSKPAFCYFRINEIFTIEGDSIGDTDGKVYYCTFTCKDTSKSYTMCFTFVLNDDGSVDIDYENALI